MRISPLFWLLLLLVAGLAGCVRRTITITSEPPGAIVWLNDREVGRTPVDVDFVFYGGYDVRLEREGYEPEMTFGQTTPPLWDNMPLDFIAEVAPVELHSRTHWHYVLRPLDDDPAALLHRAKELRSRTDESVGE